MATNLNFQFFFSNILSSPSDMQLLWSADFVNSLCTDQAWQNGGPDLDPNCLTHTLIVFLICLKKVNTQQKHEKLPSMQMVTYTVPALKL